MYKIKVKESDFFLNSDKIIANNIYINEGFAYFKTNKKSIDYLKVHEIDYEVVGTIFYKIKKSLLINKGLLFGILLFVFIIYINQYRVSKIAFNDDFVINEEIKLTVKNDMTRFLFWDFHTGNLEDTARDFRRRFVNYQWITITKKASVIHVNISNYDEFNIEQKEQVLGNIVAKRDGIIRYYNIFSGGNNLVMHKYVNQGDLLIASDRLINQQLDRQDLTEARGLVLANTFDKYTHTIYKEETKTILTSNMRQVNNINIFGMSLNLGRRNNFENYKKIIRTRFNFFGIFQIKEIEYHEKYDIIMSYNKEEAVDLIKSMIESNFKNNITSELEKIENMEVLSIQEDDLSFTISVLVQKLESIGKFEPLLLE